MPRVAPTTGTAWGEAEQHDFPIDSTTGVTGVALRLLLPRAAFPKPLAAAPPRLPKPQRADAVAGGLAWVLLGALASVVTGLLPIARPHDDNTGLAATLTLGLQMALYSLLLANYPLQVLDPYVGGMHPVGPQSRPRWLMRNYAGVAALQALAVGLVFHAAGYFPLNFVALSSITSSAAVGVSVTCARVKVARSDVPALAAALNAFSTANMAPTIATALFLWLSHGVATSDLQRLLLTGGYELCMWAVKLFARTRLLVPQGEALVMSEVFVEGLATAVVLSSLATTESSWGFAVVVAGQAAGVALLPLLHADWVRARLLPGVVVERLGEPRRPAAVARFALACAAQIALAAQVMLFVALVRAGPNAAFMSCGNWTARETARGLRYMAIWVSVFAAELALGCALVRRGWPALAPEAAPLAALRRLSEEHAAGIAGAVAVVIVVMATLTNEAYQLMWFAFPGDGVRS